MLCLAACFVVFVLIVAPSLAQRPLVMELADAGTDDAAFVISGLQEGEQLLFFAVGRASGGYAPRTTRTHLIEAADAAGLARIPFEDPIPPKFVALAVSLESGSLASWTPEGGTSREVPFPSVAVASGRAFQQDGATYLELVLVRPGGGAWAMALRDGNQYDANATSDGLLDGPISLMQPLSESFAGAPPDLESGDIFLRIAPRGLTYAMTRIVGRP